MIKNIGNGYYRFLSIPKSTDRKQEEGNFKGDKTNTQHQNNNKKEQAKIHKHYKSKKHRDLLKAIDSQEQIEKDNTKHNKQYKNMTAPPHKHTNKLNTSTLPNRLPHPQATNTERQHTRRRDRQTDHNQNNYTSNRAIGLLKHTETTNNERQHIRRRDRPLRKAGRRELQKEIQVHKHQK